MVVRDLGIQYGDIWARNAGNVSAFLSDLAVSGFITQEQALEARAEWIDEGRPEITITIEEMDARFRLGWELFKRVRDFIVTFAQSIWWSLSDFWPTLFGAIWDNAYERIGKVADWYYRKISPDPGELERYPPYVQDHIKKFQEEPSILGTFLISSYQFIWFAASIFVTIPVILKDTTRSLNRVYSPELPDMGTLTRYAYMTPEQREIVYNKAADQGFDKTEVDIFLNAALATIGPSELRDMWLRGIIDDGTLTAEMNRQGYTPERTELLKQIFYFIPGASDLVRFSVREAFDPEYIERFGTMQEFPPEFAENAALTGMSRYWAEKFWAAHWELPSIQLGFEMLHRGVISQDELDGLFKAADIMPYWRDKLLSVSYNPLTRVDARRMHKVGVLDREGLKRAYLDIGYNDENAELMTDFTVRYNQESERDLTKSDILNAYQRRLFTRDETHSSLMALGYDSREADILIDRIDYDLAKKEKETILKNLEKGYKKGLYTETQILQRMGELDMPSDESTQLIGMWEIETRDDTETLTVSELKQAYGKRIIDEDEFRGRLRAYNYLDKDIDILVELSRKTPVAG